MLDEETLQLMAEKGIWLSTQVRMHGVVDRCTRAKHCQFGIVSAEPLRYAEHNSCITTSCSDDVDSLTFCRTRVKGVPQVTS